MAFVLPSPWSLPEFMKLMAIPQLPLLRTLCTKFGTSWIIVFIRAMWLPEHTLSFCEVFFSVNKFRCEVLSASQLFSVSFSKRKFLLCSHCTRSFNFDYRRNCITISFIIISQSGWKNHGEYGGHGTYHEFELCKMRIKVSSENVKTECHLEKKSAYQTTILSRSYNKSQRDALFLNFILVKNSKCFGQIYCPSSGVLILCSQQLVFVLLVMLTVC